MRHLDRKSIERLGQAFRQAFYERRRIEFKPSEFWIVGVMSEIRRIGRLNAEIDFWTLFEKMIWKFIPAAVALVLLLSVAFTQIDPAPENIIANIYGEENLDSGLYAFYDQ
ncbi:MAG: hypothetical protein JSV31_01905 [Desulfobacterales bacterium]|jgi:hypothetical protein|nr:MAG: hypothetical protein JSV31_01905 [Desulfobacterales bacterium]